ncbi:hypothetical protein HA402_015976 [Bradysia odoriphaga]|nr:hypothetical protein HA402_015976 [Bradysia odoriphaga]
MSKKLETSDNELLSTPRSKKLKKQKKQNRSVDVDDSEVPVEVVEDSPMIEMSAAERLKSLTPKSSAIKPKKKKGRKDSGTSSEEERWLDAIESGKLEQVDDELRKIKDPKLMTARQRAMYERGNCNDKDQIPAEMLMSLPTGYKEKVLTAEAIQKAQIKSQKRKQLADEKREKDKKKTMERLLKKQESKIGKGGKNRNVKTTVPLISYRNTVKGSTLTIPPNFDYPFNVQDCCAPPEVQRCALCESPKRYNCSRTNIPLCSFKCYKLNVASLKEIMC